MNEAQELTHEDEDVNQLDWRIYAPRVRRLDVSVCNEDWATDTPRLWLMDGDGEELPEQDTLWLTVDPVTFFARSWPHWGGATPAPRYGTWKRYRYDVAWLKDTCRSLGWTLTEEESTLMDALEEYGQQAPARPPLAA